MFHVRWVNRKILKTFNKYNFISVVIFRWSLRINGSNIFSIENWIPLKPVLQGVNDVALFRVNKTESAVFISSFWFGCFRGVDIMFMTITKALMIRNLVHLYHICVNVTCYNVNINIISIRMFINYDVFDLLIIVPIFELPWCQS